MAEPLSFFSLVTHFLSAHMCTSVCARVEGGHVHREVCSHELSPEVNVGYLPQSLCTLNFLNHLKVAKHKKEKKKKSNEKIPLSQPFLNSLQNQGQGITRLLVRAMLFPTSDGRLTQHTAHL